MSAKLSHPWVTFASLSLLFFWVSAGTFSSLGVVLPAMVRELHWNWTEAGMGYTVLGVACGLASFAPAVLIRRIGVRGTIFIGSLMLVAGFAALALTQPVWVYLVGTLVIGMAFAFTTTVPGTHVLTGLFRRRSTVLGAYFTIGALGGVAGPLIYVAVQAITHGWRVYWVVFALVGAGLGLFAILTTPGKLEHEPEAEIPPEQVGPVEMIEGLRDWTVRHALLTPQYYVVVGAYTMYLLINTTAHGFAVEHLTERGISSNAAAFMLSVEALIGAVISVIGGVVGEKTSPKTLLLIAMAGVTIGMIALAQAHGYFLMSVYAVGVGIGFGLSFVASTMLLFNYYGKRANLELYSIMCLISTSAAIGPAVGGWARDTLGSFAEMFLICALAAFVMLVASFFLHPPVPAAARPATA
ncbi:MAG: MFS transporter [Caulobacteraceae bacterium]|nr:MFS transporter [Caulobacteraceae bacterium]